jgi:hypothetical protein
VRARHRGDRSGLGGEEGTVGRVEVNLDRRALGELP